jgi:hypothetical protein
MLYSNYLKKQTKAAQKRSTAQQKINANELSYRAIQDSIIEQLKSSRSAIAYKQIGIINNRFEIKVFRDGIVLTRNNDITGEYCSVKTAITAMFVEFNCH